VKYSNVIEKQPMVKLSKKYTLLKLSPIAESTIGKNGAWKI
jgi:hypothetical protein